MPSQSLREPGEGGGDMTVRGERWRDVMEGDGGGGGRREKCRNDGGEGHVHQSSLTGVRYGDRNALHLYARLCTPPIAMQEVLCLCSLRRNLHIQVIQNNYNYYNNYRHEC